MSNPVLHGTKHQVPRQQRASPRPLGPRHHPLPPLLKQPKWPPSSVSGRGWGAGKCYAQRHGSPPSSPLSLCPAPGPQARLPLASGVDLFPLGNYHEGPLSGPSLCLDAPPGLLPPLWALQPCIEGGKEEGKNRGKEEGKERREGWRDRREEKLSLAPKSVPLPSCPLSFGGSRLSTHQALNKAHHCVGLFFPYIAAPLSNVTGHDSPVDSFC